MIPFLVSHQVAVSLFTPVQWVLVGVVEILV